MITHLKLKKSLALLGATLLALGVMTALPGCIWGKANPAATQPATEGIDRATTKPSYWLKQPAVAQVTYPAFQPLWNACEETARSYLFPLDEQDYRSGVLTTAAVISRQFLEPWRKDAPTGHDVVQSSLVTVCRNIRFEIVRNDTGAFVMTPKVLVQRETIIERRITSVAQYRFSFAGPAAPVNQAVQSESLDLPAKYWTPIGRDETMERQLAADIRARLKN